MNNEMTIEDMLQELHEKIAWFHSDEFTLEDAARRFAEVQKLAAQIEERLLKMKNEVEMVAETMRRKP